jgi:hypothetical protein
LKVRTSIAVIEDMKHISHRASFRKANGGRRAALAVCWLAAVLAPVALHAATKSLESSPNSGFVVSADFEDLGAPAFISRTNRKFRLNRAPSRDEAALLKFLDEFPSTSSGGITPIALKSRLKWGDLTLFKLALHGKYGDSTTSIPVRCGKACDVWESLEKVPGVQDPELPVSTFAYFEEERARLVDGELPRTRSFPVTLRVLPGNLPPSSPFPFTFSVDMRLAFATQGRLALYDFSTQAWRGSPPSNQVAWQGLAKFLTGLRRAGPTGVGRYLNEQFGNASAEHFLYSVNTFDGTNVTSDLLKADAFAEKVRNWPAIVPLGVVQDGPAQRLFFSTSTKLEDVQQMPIRCEKANCRVVDADWVSYVHGVIQQPGLLRLYRSMFQKAAAGRIGQK